MTRFTDFFIKGMTEEVIELTCAAMVNILKYIPGVQGADDVIRPCSLALIPDELKTQKMYEKSEALNPCALQFVPDHLKTKRICKEGVEDESETSKFVPEHFKDKKVCERAIKNEPGSLKFVPDFFITEEQIGVWYCNDDKLIEWHNDYK